MPLILRRQRQIAEIGGVTLPGHGVAARPVAMGLRADGKCHAEAVSGVEAAAAHLGQIPARPQIAGSHLGIGLEAPAGQDHRARLDGPGLAGQFDHDALHPVIVADQLAHPGVIGDGDALPLGSGIERIHQARPAGRDSDGRPAPELELAIDPKGLAAEIGHEAHTLVPHPAQRLAAAAHQDLAKIGIGAILGDAGHVVEEIILGISPEIGARDLFRRQVGAKRDDIVDTVIDDAHEPVGIGRVAAALLDRSPLQNQHARAMFPR